MFRSDDDVSFDYDASEISLYFPDMLNEDQKFLLSLWAWQQYSSTQIADIHGQTDYNIRKVRNTMMKKIRKKLLAVLIPKVQTQQSLALIEKKFLTENGVDIEKDTQ